MRFEQNNVVKISPYSGHAVMVLGGISAHFKLELVLINGTINKETYQHEILANHVVQVMRNHVGMFQQDNAYPHIRRICKDYLVGQNIPVLPWPA